ncbi:MAG: hypothetical protein V4547_16560 [Bacteroidota bacterium]
MKKAIKREYLFGTGKVAVAAGTVTPSGDAFITIAKNKKGEQEIGSKVDIKNHKNVTGLRFENLESLEILQKAVNAARQILKDKAQIEHIAQLEKSGFRPWQISVILEQEKRRAERKIFFVSTPTVRTNELDHCLDLLIHRGSSPRFMSGSFNFPPYPVPDFDFFDGIMGRAKAAAKEPKKPTITVQRHDKSAVIHSGNVQRTLESLLKDNSVTEIFLQDGLEAQRAVLHSADNSKWEVSRPVFTEHLKAVRIAKSFDAMKDDTPFFFTNPASHKADGQCFYTGFEVTDDQLKIYSFIDGKGKPRKTTVNCKTYIL